MEEITKKARAVRPREPGAYIGVNFNKHTITALTKFCKENNVPKRFRRDRCHATILYSKKPCPGIKPMGKLNEKAAFKGWDIFPNYDNTKKVLVMLLDSPWMVSRHNELMDKHDASYDFDEYKPHVTLSYDVGNDFDVDKLPDFPQELSLINEYYEDLVIDWQNKDES